MWQRSAVAAMARSGLLSCLAPELAPASARALACAAQWAPPSCCGLSSSATPSNAMALVKQLRERSGAPIKDVKDCLAANDWDADAAYDALRRKGLAAAAKKAARHAAEGLVGLATAPGGAAAALVEVNSETDFVARNEMFQALVSDAAAALLASAGHGGGGGGGTRVVQVDEQQLAELAAGSSGATLAARTAEVGAAVREAVKLRRGFVVTTDGVLAGYCHAPVAPGLGRIASVVALGRRGAGPDAAAAARLGGAAPLASSLAMHVAGLRPLYLDPAAVPADTLAAERAVLADAAAAGGKAGAVVDKVVAGRLRKWFQEVCLVEQRYLLDDALSVGQWLEQQGQALAGAPLAVQQFLRVQVGEGLEQATSPGFAAQVQALAADGS